MPEFMDWSNWLEGRQQRRDARRDAGINSVLAAIMGLKGGYDQKQAAKAQAEKEAYERSIKERELGAKELGANVGAMEAKQKGAAAIAEFIGRGLDAVKAAPEADRQTRYEQFLGNLKQQGVNPEEFGFGDVYLAPKVDQHVEEWRRTADGLKRQGEERMSAPPPLMQRDPTKPLVDPRTGQEVSPGVPAAPTPPSNLDAAILDAERRGDTAAVERYMQLKERVAKAGRAAAGQAPMSQTMEANIINRLTTQWTAASAPARDLDRQVALMDAGITAARRGDLAQGSQVVLVTFQKILDPPSVVRESEYMRSAAGQSLINRVRGAKDRIVQGGAGVTLAELEKFATLAKEASAVQNREYLQATKERIGKTADRYRIPRELIFEEMPDPAVTPPPPAAPTSQAAPGGPQVGGIVTFQGKRYRVKAIVNGQAELEPVP